MSKILAEFIGTFTLVIVGCGAAVIAGADGTTGIGLAGISLAFGLALVGMAYGIGSISGCHINPAVSLGVMLSGQMKSTEMLQYWMAQIAGAITAAAVLMLIASGSASYTGGLGANGWGPGYLGEYGVLSAFVFEAVGTFLFLVVILGATANGANGQFAGLAIGLTLVAIHLVGIKVTGVSVNPARSIGPALFAGGNALSQLWLFVVAPAFGAATAGLLFRLKMLEPQV